MRNATITSLLCVALLAGPAVAAPPEHDPKISLAVRERPAGEVVGAIADKAGWSLTASGEHLERKVSVRIKGRAASEVLATVAEVAGLETRFDGDALVVQDARPAPAVAPVAAVAPPAGPGPRLDEADGDEAQDQPAREDVVEKAQRKAKHAGHKSHGNDRTAVGEDVEVAPGETVGDVVSTGGSVTIRGHATGDAVAVGGSVTLEPGARVDGDAVAIGGTVEIKPGASLGGERTSVGGALGKVLSGAVKLSPSKGSHGGHQDHEGNGFFGRLWWTLPFFVIGFLMMLFVPDRLLGLREALSARPWAATAAGIGSWFGIVALCVLLAVTIIGIPLIPLALVGFFGLGVFGLTALAWWTGAKLSFVPGTQRPLVAFCLGTLVLMLIAAIPVIGTLTLVTATTVSGGATLLLLIASWRRRRQPPAATPDELGI
jgi:hypothetical protein